MTILINNDIPSTMTQAGLNYLGKMAKTVPENGVIIEVGPLFGSSTWVLAKNAHPSVEVISIDTWEPAPWIDKIEKKFDGCLPFSLETFKEYVKDCQNVTPIQGWSPDIVSDWDRPIDMFFDDASHGNPGFTNNLNFFVPKVKPNGIICGDDYAVRWPTIVREVDSLASEWSTEVEIIGRVWSMVKPEFGQSRSVYSLLEKSDEPAIEINVISNSGKEYIASPNTFAGALHKPDPIQSIKIGWANSVQDLDLRWKLALRKEKKPGWQLPLRRKKETDWLNTGETYELQEGTLISGISATLLGAKSKSYRVEYQLGLCKADDSTKRLQNTRAEHASRMLSSVEDDAVVNAVLINVSKRD